MDKLIAFVMARLKEPSTWAALGTLLVTGGILSADAHQKYLVMIGALCAIAGAGMSERSAAIPSAQSPAAPSSNGTSPP